LLSIGDVAARSGVSVSAIRFYERRGLLEAPERVGGQRRFAPAVIRRLEIVGIAKRAGFSLDEVAGLLGSTDRGAPAHQPLRELASRKLPEIDSLIARAELMRGWLSAAEECGCETLEGCALFAGSEA
jgi:MerR family redox-sensitive transcriptional activator SoxR